MVVSYDSTLKATRMTAVISALDTPSGFAHLSIYTAAYATLLVNIILPKPSFLLTSGVLTLLGVPLNGTAIANGTAALAQLKDGTQSTNVAFHVQGLTVGTSSADIVVNATNIISGEIVTIVSGTITAAP